MSERRDKDLAPVAKFFANQAYFNATLYDEIRDALAKAYDLGLARGQQEPDAETAALARLGEAMAPVSGTPHWVYYNATVGRYICRHCRKSASTWANIPHSDTCPVPPALAAIVARKEKDDE